MLSPSLRQSFLGYLITFSTEALGTSSGRKPNNSFKPNLLRYTKARAEKACHGFAFTTQVGLTQALGALGEITMRSVFVILLSTFIAACSTLQQPSRTYVEALIRHELSSPKSYLSSNRQTYYVGVVSRDLSAAEISAL